MTQNLQLEDRVFCNVVIKMVDGEITLFFDIPGTEPGQATMTSAQAKAFVDFTRDRADPGTWRVK